MIIKVFKFERNWDDTEYYEESDSDEDHVDVPSAAQANSAAPAAADSDDRDQTSAPVAEMRTPWSTPQACGPQQYRS